MIRLSMGPLLRQYLIVILVNLSVLCVGLGLAWPSPVLVKLRNETETVLPKPITEEQGSWIVSIGFLTAAGNNFLSGYLVDRIGRKYCIILSYIPRLLTGLILTFATEVWMIMLGRVISGFSDSLVFNVVPVYASEVASKEVRGSLGTILQMFSSIGIVTMLCIGPFTGYFQLNLVLTIIAAVTFIPMFFIPDSPYFLHSKGREEETLKVLIYLRGSEAKAKDEMKEYSISDSTEKVDKIALFKNKVFLKALAIVIIIGMGTQLIGFNAVSFYLQTILESTQTSVKPEIASVVIGLIQLFASLFTTIVTDKFGRKPILTSTLTGMALGMIGLGAFFKLKETNEISGFLNYLPLISLILVVFCYSAGLGSLVWIVVAELFDGTARAVGMSSCLMSATLLTFFTTKYFDLLTTALGPAVMYWTFGINCLFLCMFIMFCIPETKGKSFTEIQTNLGAKQSDYNVNMEKIEKKPEVLAIR